MTQTAHGISDIGRKRKNNEDNFLIRDEKGLYIVADGMGGHNAGEVASINAVNRIDLYLTRERIEDMNAHQDIIKKELTDAVINAHNWIRQSAETNKEHKGMGTTIVLGFILHNTLFTCHVGDSRAYVINTSGIHQITGDHSYVGELVRAGTMTSEEARHSKLKNRISQALGSPFPIKPEYHEYPLIKNDRVLLCTDGLWDMLSDDDIYNSLFQENSLENACNILISKANKAGGNDNITVILINPT